MRIQIDFTRAPGDLLAFTIALHSLHTLHPSAYETCVQSSFPELLEGNPNQSKFTEPEKVIRLDRSTATDQGRAGSLPASYCVDLSKALGRLVYQVVDEPRVYLRPDEANAFDLPSRYVVLNAGRKEDYPLKMYPYWQEVVTRLPVSVIQVGRLGDYHPRLEGAKYLIGKTSLRQLLSLVADPRCLGGLGPVSLLAHICAAFSKPYVCLAGGREPSTWCAYPKQVSLISLPPCSPCWCKGYACNRLVGRYASCLDTIQPQEISDTAKRIFNLETK